MTIHDVIDRIIARIPCDPIPNTVDTLKTGSPEQKVKGIATTFLATHSVLVCGEINEWETAEYVRDSNAIGQNLALVVIGHAASEEAGMQHVASWLEPIVPGIPIRFIAAGDPFSAARRSR